MINYFTHSERMSRIVHTYAQSSRETRSMVGLLHPDDRARLPIDRHISFHVTRAADSKRRKPHNKDLLNIFEMMMMRCLEITIIDEDFEIRSN